MQTDIAAQPDAAVGGLRDRADAAIRQAALRTRRQAADQAQLRVQDGHTLLGRADPDLAIGQLRHAAHIRVHQHIVVTRRLASHPDAAIGRVVALQAAAIAARPEPAGAVAQQGAHLVAGQAGGVARVVAQQAQQTPIERAHLDAAGAADPDLARGGGHEGGHRAMIAGPGQQLRAAITGHVDQGQIALLAAGPDAAILGLVNAGDDALGQRLAGAGQHRLEHPAAGQAPAQALPAADPQNAAAVDQQGLHPVIGQALGGAAVVLEAAAGRVEAVEPAANGADPDRPVAILGQRTDGAGGQGIAAAGLAAVDGDLLGAGIVEGQAVGLGAYPQAPVARRQQRAHKAQALTVGAQLRRGSCSRHNASGRRRCRSRRSRPGPAPARPPRCRGWHCPGPRPRSAARPAAAPARPGRSATGRQEAGRRGNGACTAS